MIIRIHIEGADGIYKIQSEDTKHVTTDKSEYLFTLLGKNFIINENINRGLGFIDSQINFDLDDTDGMWNAMLDDTERGILEGRKVVIYGYKEELNGSWALVEKFKYIGRIATANKSGIDQMHFLITSMYSELDMVAPNNIINKVEYPSAMDSSYGKYIPWLYGDISGEFGNVPAWNVAPNTYLFCDFDINSDNGILKEIFWRGVRIDESLWAMYIEGGRVYISYTPPASDDELPAKDVEFLSCNVVTEKVNPILVLKDICYRRIGSYDFFNGDAGLEADFNTRNIKFASVINDGDSLREIITQFCKEFNVNSYITDDGKLQLKAIGGASVQTFTDSNGTIQEGREEVIKGEIVNDVIFEGEYNFSGKKFTWQENYKNRKSIGLSGTFEGKMSYFFVENKDVGIKLIKENIQQKKYGKKRIFIDTKYTDIENRNLGDTISVRSIYFSGIELKQYTITKMSTDLISENSIIEAIIYISEVDYIVNVHRDIYGGDIELLGMNAVQSGQRMVIDIQVLIGFTIGFYWLDGVKQTGSNEIILNNITADHDVFIVFNTTKYIIQASDDGNTTISPKGQVLLTAGGSQPFSVASGFSYFLWNGTKYYTNPLSVTGDRNHTISAHGSTVYAARATLTLNFDGTKGRVTNVRGIDRYSKVSKFKVGTVIVMMFHPDGTNNVTYVEKDGVDVTAGATSHSPAGLMFTITADTAVTVTFA